MFVPYHSTVPHLAEKNASVFRDEKIRDFILVPVTGFDILRCPWLPRFGDCTILSGPFAVTVVVSAAEPEEAFMEMVTLQCPAYLLELSRNIALQTFSTPLC